VELAPLVPDAAHMDSTEVAVHASTTESGNTASDETADTASAEGANMASAEAATVITTPATRLRVGCKQAASQRRGHQDSYYPSQHEFFLSVRRRVRQGFAEPIRPFPTETDLTPWSRFSARRRRRFRIFVIADLFLRQSPTPDPDFSA